MKRKIILTLIMSAMLLTACRAEEQSINTAETTAETAKNTEEELTEAENGSRLKASFIDSDIINPAGGELNGYTKFIITDGNILFVPLFSNFDVSLATYYDINESAVVQQFDPLDYWGEPNAAPAEGKEILYKARVFRQNEEGEQYPVVCAVYTDRTFNILEDTIENNSIQPYGIAEWQFNIVNAETGEMLIKGYNPSMEGEYIEGYGWDTSIPRYQFPIDENRFVYQTSGVNALACIGVYDLESNETREIPNSVDFKPLGVRDGKIYLADGLWDFSSDKIKILAADPDTLETEVYMEWSKSGDGLEFAMSEDGKYIAVLYNNSGRFYVIETDTKEIINGNIPEEFPNPTPICFADNDTVVVANWLNKILLIDIQEAV